MNTNDKSLVGLLEKVSTKLNDKQLYLLVIYLLERNLHNMWKHAAIGRLKENIQIKNENTLIMNEENSNNRIWKTANNTNIGLLAFDLFLAFN
ncbi:hypothetical protein RFI_34081 [Reticulomyxa filosa]|uniref:Uncharacterized protein n=1 Tax=Reticulomyxa filosa TaxID=46433 RepID=X6LNY7_RETFI|nr:hypothetical protein RFI_34081 [Reticulomyxa filosa]|eukprot:ETO03329.1 hypothetical protein RFI_34081 [Reticulomyxa filosa]